MYISAGDAKLKGQNIHHTLECGNIAEQVEQPIRIRIVKCAVNNRQQHRNNGQKVEPSFLHAAFEKHNYECGKGTQHLPAHTNEVTYRVTVVFVCPHGGVLRKGKYELVQVICEHEQKQYAGDDPQNRHSLGEFVFIRLSQ